MWTGLTLECATPPLTGDSPLNWRPPPLTGVRNSLVDPYLHFAGQKKVSTKDRNLADPWLTITLFIGEESPKIYIIKLI
jgi:hypothetical protein